MSDNADIVEIVRELLLAAPRVAIEAPEHATIYIPHIEVAWPDVQVTEADAARRYNAALTRAVDWLIAQQGPAGERYVTPFSHMVATPIFERTVPRVPRPSMAPPRHHCGWSWALHPSNARRCPSISNLGFLL